MKFLILMLFSCLGGEIWAANISSRDTINEEEERVITDVIPDSYIERLDYFYSTWYTGKQDSVNYVDSAYISANKNNIVPCNDSVYLLRIDSMQSAIQLSYNDIVRNCIELYTVRKRFQLANMLGMSEYYFPLFEQELDAACMPQELKYLAIIESALNPKALSKAGASGLWQFMYATGRMYKLEVNSYIDERRDPVLATKAAVRYLNDLYSIYEDWILVLAAYNCGPGNVNKAIRRAGGKRNYWDIYYHLPSETRGYVPLFIGAMYAFNYHKEHGVYAIESTLPRMCDTIVVSEAVHFDQIAKNLDISVEELRDLNPQYRMDVIPAGLGKSYVLKMPFEHVSCFIDRQDTIFACDRTKYFNDSDRTADPKERIKVHPRVVGDAGGRERLVYTVKSNDVPGGIADRFNVKLADLKYWNNLNKKLTIRPGQKLVIYVPEKKAAQYKGKVDYSEKESNVAVTPKIATTDDGFVFYTVRKGENLWGIAKKYPGVSNRDIMKWNNLSDREAKGIMPGQKLKIKI